MDQERKAIVIIPCYNEGAVICKTVQEVLSYGYDVVLVDDASGDNTRELVKDLPVDYIRHKVNLGQGAALQTGIDFAGKKGAKYLVTFDADGQHDPADIEKMISLMEEKKVDIVFGSRFLPGAKTNVSVSRGLLLNLGRYLNYFFSGALLSDAHNGIRVLNSAAANKIRLKENRMAHATEFQVQVVKNRLKYAECPVSIQYNEYSKSKGQSSLNSIKILFEVILSKIFRQ